MNLELITDFSYFYEARLGVTGPYIPITRCVECNMESDIIIKDTAHPNERLAKALNKEGWRQDDYGNCYCPNCVDLAKHW